MNSKSFTRYTLLGEPITGVVAPCYETVGVDVKALVRRAIDPAFFQKLLSKAELQQKEAQIKADAQANPGKYRVHYKGGKAVYELK